MGNEDKNIEINLTENIYNYAIVIAIALSLGSIWLSINLYYKSQDNDTSKKTYETLSVEINKQYENNQKNYENLVVIKSQMEVLKEKITWMNKSYSFPPQSSSLAPSDLDKKLQLPLPELSAPRPPKIVPYYELKRL